MSKSPSSAMSSHLHGDKSRWTPPPHPVEQHVNVLKLTTCWEIKAIRDSAIYGLSTYNDEVLPPIQKLYLARLYDIPSLGDGDRDRN